MNRPMRPLWEFIEKLKAEDLPPEQEAKILAEIITDGRTARRRGLRRRQCPQRPRLHPACMITMT
jgi:hypothetical protein